MKFCGKKKCFGPLNVIYIEFISQILWKKNSIFSKLSDAMSIALCRFRACNHKLPIESGRYLNIPRSERSCHLCNVNDLCDEYHVIFKCEALNSLRQKYLPYYQRRIRQNTSVMALYNIFNTSERHLKKLTLFIINLTKLFTWFLYFQICFTLIFFLFELFWHFYVFLRVLLNLKPVKYVKSSILTKTFCSDTK